MNKIFLGWWSLKETIANSKKIKIISKHYPWLSSKVRNRLRLRQFRGLTLTSICLVFLYTLFLLFGVVEDVLDSDSIVTVDRKIEIFLAHLRTPLIVKMFLWVTTLGEWYLLLCAAIIIVAFLWFNKKTIYLLPFLISICGAEFITYIGKLTLRRPRPDGLIPVFHETTFSFPSGHATISVVFYGFLAYMIMRNLSSWKKRILVLALFSIVILAIGFSRMYLGVHFLSDVWAGYLVGLLWLLIGITMTEWKREKILVRTTTRN